MNSTAPYADAAAVELLRVTQDSEWREGSAEPWVANILEALVVGNATRVAVEIGCFEGYTSKHLLRALSGLPWPTKLWLCELEPERAAATLATISEDGLKVISAERVEVVVANSLEWIPTLPDESVDFVWLDGCHEQPHVLQEIQLLLSKLAPGGIIAGHDVYGVCNLHRVFSLAAQYTRWQSASLDLPRLGPAGGIGLLQRPR